jgi:hypothetical protein
MDKWHDIVGFLASFLGGGFTVAVGNWIHANRSARREREATWLQEQLRALYGPLSFLTSQNEQLFKLAGDVQNAHQSFFTGKWSEDPATQEHLEKQGEATTALGNMYIKRVLKNNARAMAILEAIGTWRTPAMSRSSLRSRLTTLVFSRR